MGPPRRKLRMLTKARKCGADLGGINTRIHGVYGMAGEISAGVKTGFGALGLAAALAVMVAGGSSQAQENSELSIAEVVEQCSKVADPAGRLECYDALATSLRPQAASAPAEGGEPSPAPAPETALTASADASPDQPSEERERRFIIVDTGSVAGKKVVRETKKQKGQPFIATVVAAKRNNVGKLFVQFDDGQIWRTLDGEGDIEIPEKGVEAQLRKSMFFSWWVTFGDGKKVKMVPFSID